MNRFEKQLSASSKRLAAEQMKGIAPVEKPSVRRHISVAYFSTPIAAVAGLLVGLFLQLGTPKQNSNDPVVVQIHDTIVEYVHDTIRIDAIPPILTAQAHSQTPQKESKSLLSASGAAPHGKQTQLGKTIAEDGIDYSKLILCIY